MKVYAIVGSYRKEGNTDIIIEEILKGAREQGAEAEKVFVDDLEIKSCQGCYECKKEGKCKIEDDVIKVVRKIDEADGVIVGSPNYGNHLTGQLKILLDRMMGVINKVTYKPGKGREAMSLLQPKKRNIITVITNGAPEPKCADDALKLTRMMFGSFSNGGTMEEIIATSVTGHGQILMSQEELAKLMRMQGIPNAEEAAKNLREKYDQTLTKAYELGQAMVDKTFSK